MKATAVRYFDRLQGEEKVEQIYGEASLRWAYYNPIGRIFLKLLIKNPVFSRLFGWRMSRPGSRKKIAAFVAEYGLDPGEFLEALDSYSHFNDFFYRKLKPEARPLAEGAEQVVFPADGRHLLLPDLGQVEAVFAKGQRFSLESILGSTELAKFFEGGAALISRLCPVDYHRFHFPMGGVVSEAQLINGPLYSVNPLALRQNIGYLIENKRWLVRVDTDAGFPIMMVVIGATCVGSADFTYVAGESVAKGDECGYFSFGGSCVVTLYPRGKVAWDQDLIGCSGRGLECYDQVGRKCGMLA